MTDASNYLQIRHNSGTDYFSYDADTDDPSLDVTKKSCILNVVDYTEFLIGFLLVSPT